ncbi:hypothetical protein N7456_004078 [Penicillium angulare]|uniref:Fe2OG dioxygenase domain-containing protein n=1 Tax=Penicillium angulare TaxID=116970 RepID=A0A9W9FW05_9EURO|nr:hypothetical protein N7456_004078 [Penicillium angulare]
MTVSGPLEARFGDIQVPAEVQRGEFTEIPVVDLANMASESLADRKQVAAEIYKVATTVGFFYIKNHGLPQELFDDAEDWSRRFFELPHEIKMKSFCGGRNNEFIGYLPQAEDLPVSAASHLHVAAASKVEAYALGYENDADERKKAGDPPPSDPFHLHGPNAWPSHEELPGFQEWQLYYYGELLKFSHRLTKLIALALNLDDSAFDHLFNSPGSICRLMHYLPRKVSAGEHASIKPHTDIDFFTILLQGKVPGLQVRNRKGDWIAAPLIPNALVVNIGDTLHYLTNGIFKSTPHRAINLTGEQRRSIPFFMNVDHTATIGPMPEFVTKQRPAIREPFVYGEWLRNLMAGSN